MAFGGVRPPPYTAVVALLHWVSRRRNWYLFDGWCAARGIAPLELPACRALDLIFYYIIEHTPEEDRRGLVNSLTGPRLTDEKRRQQVAAQAPDEPPMPSWWTDDDDASMSSQLAAAQLHA